jgi:hypothetical protein
MPVLRGENGQQGKYSLFYNEVEDIVAAAEYLAKLPSIDAAHWYVGFRFPCGSCWRIPLAAYGALYLNYGSILS